MYRGLILFILVFLLGCQNRNEVTHSKRKYRKGYYKPNRAKVKYKKSKQEEKYTYQTKSKDDEEVEETSSKQSSSKTQHSSESKKQSQEKEIESRTISEDNEVVDATPSSDKEKKYQRRVRTKQGTENEPNQRALPERHKANWVFWVSLFLYIILSLGVILSLFIIESAVIIISIILAIALAIIVINIWNIASHEKNEENRFIRGSSIVFVSLFFAFLAIAAIILILVINYT